MPDNYKFILSGVALGGYVFPQNPADMNIVAPRSKSSIMNLIRGENIYMRPLLDNEARIMNWARVPVAMYDALKPYAEPDANGDIPVSYFWDGDMNEFQGTSVKVHSVYGEPLSHEQDVWSLKIQFSPWRI